MTPTESGVVLGVLAAAWPNVTMSDETSNLWRAVLASLDHDHVMCAIGLLVMESEFFPSIAKLRETLASVDRPERDAASEQWTAQPDCPECFGTGLVRDAQGRDFLCRCADRSSHRPLARPALTNGPRRDITGTLRDLRARLDARRGAGDHKHGGPGHCHVCGGQKETTT